MEIREGRGWPACLAECEFRLWSPTWQVHPPQRFVEVYYNNWADDFYTAITTSSNRFGPRWWFREALSHGPTEVLAWLRHWYRMAKKHGVLHDSVGRMLSDALKDTLEGESGIGARTEMQRYGALKDRMRKWREPRIIAIGDVHGCIDEVRALIKVRQPGSQYPRHEWTARGSRLARHPAPASVL